MNSQESKQLNTAKFLTTQASFASSSGAAKRSPEDPWELSYGPSGLHTYGAPPEGDDGVPGELPKFLTYAEKLEIENVHTMNRQDLIVAVVKKRFIQELPKLIFLAFLSLAIMKIF